MGRALRRLTWDDWESGIWRRAYLHLTNKELNEEMVVGKRWEKRGRPSCLVRVKYSLSLTQDKGLVSPDLYLPPPPRARGLLPPPRSLHVCLRSLHVSPLACPQGVPLPLPLPQPQPHASCRQVARF